MEYWLKRGSDGTDSVHGEWTGNDPHSPPKIRRITKDANDQSKRGISVCLKDMVKGVLLNSASGALRYQRKCLVKIKGVDHGQPLPTVSLPSIFRQHPTPMSNCTLDIPNVVPRKIAITSSIFTHCLTATDKRIVYQPHFRTDLLQSLFTSLLINGITLSCSICIAKLWKAWVLPVKRNNNEVNKLCIRSVLKCGW